jgi:uncharacterized protein
MNSAIFEGWVSHRRVAPLTHGFRYRLFMMYLDLAEIDEVFKGRWLWSARRWAVARFRRSDHFGDPGVSLDASVRQKVYEQTGHRPLGPIRLLTHLSYFGYCFNPVSFYYCFDERDEAVETIVAEVNNTPWGERHLYVLGESDNNGDKQVREFAPRKAMHVSPFMEMDVHYLWRFGSTRERLLVNMETARDGGKIFNATLSLGRTEITGRSLARVLTAYPFMTLRVIALIHWQALLLWLKGAPVHDHPAKRAGLLESQS